MRSRATMCTSEAELAELQELCGDRAPLMLVRNGVPVPSPPSREERAQARKELEIPEDAVVALMMNRLEPRKRPLSAARATLLAEKEGANLVLLVAGDGPLRRDLSGLAGPSIRLLGFRRDPENLLAAADLFVLVSEWEGLSLSLLEAMAAGVPALVSDGPGNPEVVDAGSGRVVPLGDEEALAQALVEFAASPQHRAEAGAAARRRVAEHFTLEQMVAGVEAAYARCLA